MTQPAGGCLVSIIVLNFNGKRWVHRCLESLKSQTCFEKIEIIIADNQSTDGSDDLFHQSLAGWKNAQFIQNGANIGFAAGSNRVVDHTSGKYLFFLNPDIWLEADCVEQLYRTAETNKAAAVGPYVMNYDDDSFQSFGGIGFDVCSLGVPLKPDELPKRLFVSNGFVFIRRDVFDRLGRYNEQFFLYGEETDLSWRLWISGEQLVPGRSARIHHRGAASVNPEGGTKIVEFRTSDLKRYHANRNNVLILLYHAQHLLLVCLFPLLMLLFVESLVGMLLSRRWSTFQTTFLMVIRDCWKLRGQIAGRRKFIRSFRRHGDFWMLRFFTWRLSHWEDFKRVFKLGPPRIDK
jgi:GT2 family glycosyltransferase